MSERYREEMVDEANAIPRNTPLSGESSIITRPNIVEKLRAKAVAWAEEQYIDSETKMQEILKETECAREQQGTVSQNKKKNHIDYTIYCGRGDDGF